MLTVGAVAPALPGNSGSVGSGGNELIPPAPFSWEGLCPPIQNAPLDTPPKEGGYSGGPVSLAPKRNFPFVPSRRGLLTRRIEGQYRIGGQSPQQASEDSSPRKCGCSE